VRRGIAYVARRADGALLLEERPAEGLLGGMLGWPGTDWAEAAPDPAPPLAAAWRDAGAGVRHTFTHFHLALEVMVAEVAAGAAPDRGRFLAPAEVRRADLPSLMRKVHDLALAALDATERRSPD
jgi:A/G-specific adenine glycosylase